MSIKYARFSVSIHGLDTDLDWAKFLEGYLHELIKSHLGGALKSKINFRDEYDSDVEVELEETAGEDPGYIERVCKNCKFWWKSERCTSPKFKYTFTRSMGGDPEPDGILIEFDEEWGAICGPEFGCIHYEERENGNRNQTT